MRQLAAIATVAAFASVITGCGGPLKGDAPVPTGSTTGGGTVTAATQPNIDPVKPSIPRADVMKALISGAREASSKGVTIHAAVASGQWQSAAQVDGQEPLRMWSTAKVLTAVAAMRAAAESTKPPQKDLKSSIDGALQRSENCRQRNVVLWLQQMSGGPAEAADAMRAEIDTAGASGAKLPETPAPVPDDCVAFLKTSGVSDPLGPALQMGTATWSPVAGSQFALALAAGELGTPGDKIYKVMQHPKMLSRETVDQSGYTADVNWGAGIAMTNLRPAYKAGWGGTEQHDFIAGQIVALRTASGSYGISVFGTPDAQPTADDPGLTAIPDAVEAVLRRLAVVLGRE